MPAIAVRIYLVYAAGLLAVGLFCLFGQGFWQIPPHEIWRDLILLSASAYLLGLALYVARRTGLDRLRIAVKSPWLVALAVLIGCWLARRFVLQGFEPSRDEQLAVFDAAIFQSGRLFVMLPPEWVPDAESLNREFLLPLVHPVGWVSGYLPMNAAIRATFAQVGLGDWASPAMAAGSILLIWSIARHLWPDDRGAAGVAMLMLAGSGQFIFSGMTAYAMTAHLFCNLAWLRLFLIGRRWADLLAILIGFVATGLHQPVFHPLFAGPLIALLAWQRQWQRTLVYGVAYLAIAGFWYLWPEWMAGQIADQASLPAVQATTLSYADRLSDIFHIDWSNLFLQTHNLLALAAWQHILLAPLCVMSIRLVGRSDLMLALAGGAFATVIVMGLILPYQGFGYGFRYMHGQLGSLALFAALAWHQLAADRERYEALLGWATILGIVLLMPLQIWQPYASYQDLIAAKRRMTASGVDLFILDSQGNKRTELLAYNSPDLTTRPVLVMLDRITDPAGFARRHCSPGTTVAFGTQRFYHSGIADLAAAEIRLDGAGMSQLRERLKAAGCRLHPVD